MELAYFLVIFSAFIFSMIIWFIVGYNWKKLSDFFHARYSYIDLSFIGLYFIEQLILSYLIYIKLNAQIIAGLFSLIIIGTASLQNKYWESRTKRIGDKSLDQARRMRELRENNKELIKDNEKLKKEIPKLKEFIDYLYDELNMIQKDLKKKG